MATWIKLSCTLFDNYRVQDEKEVKGKPKKNETADQPWQAEAWSDQTKVLGQKKEKRLKIMHFFRHNVLCSAACP